MDLETERGADLFPRDHCEGLFSELSMWTSVQDILAGARFLENRKARDDVFAPKLLNRDFAGNTDDHLRIARYSTQFHQASQSH
jgi:hypothetical protein